MRKMKVEATTPEETEPLHRGPEEDTSLWKRLRTADADDGGAVIPGVDQVLLSFGQVIFCGSRLTGLLFFASLFLSNPWLAVLALLGCVSGLLAAVLMGCKASFVNSGLAGYNGVLVGCAFAVFLPGRWALRPALATAFGGASSTVVTVAFNKWSSYPAWTYPFNLCVLSVFLHSRPFKEAPAAPPPHEPQWNEMEAAVLAVNLGKAFICGLGQIFVAGEWPTGILVLLGGLWYWPRLGCSLAVGSCLGIVTGVCIGAKPVNVIAGLYGFNPALSAAAVCTFGTSRLSNLLLFWGAIASQCLAAGIAKGLSVEKIPACTLPFCLVATLIFPLLDAKNNDAEEEEEKEEKEEREEKEENE